MIAFVFPGQNSQHVGMGEAFDRERPECRAVLDTACQVLGRDLRRLMFEGPEQDLTQTQNQQAAIVTHSLAALAALQAEGVAPDFVAGQSLGEYTAVMASGALPVEAGLRLVQRRAELMAEAARKHPGCMAAVLGLEGSQVRQICERAQEEGVVRAANFNAPGQVVISGEEQAVAAASRAAKEAGAKRVVRLDVSGAFHTQLMAPAAEGLAVELAGATWADGRVPVVTNVDAREKSAATDLQQALRRQLTSPVLWEQSVRRMGELGVDTFVEVGPGRVLSGMIRRILPDARRLTVSDPTTLEETLTALR